MRAFKFRAEAALDLRRRRDQDAQRLLAAAQRDADRAAAAVAAAHAALDAARSEAAKVLAGAHDIVAVTWHRNWMTRADDRLRAEREVLVRAQQAVTRATEHARDARKQLRALERLRARAREAYDAETLRLEQRDLDEFATQKAASARQAAEW